MTVEHALWSPPLAQSVYVAVALLILAYSWYLYCRRRARELRALRELEEMVLMRTRELAEHNTQLAALSRAKSDFVARMSHELRTPMNAVLGMSELLMDMHLPPAQRRFVEGIHRSADSLLGIVDDVLDFSKLEAGRLQLVPAPCDLVELVEQVSEMLTARAAAKGVEVICDAPPRGVPEVRADAVRLRQVLVNLGGNAVKFTERGTVTLRLAVLGVSADMLRVRIDVADTGIGIEPRNQSRIFEEFHQEDASTTRRFGGTGLGLSIVRQVVELMGGVLSLTSEPGIGSTFAFELSLPLADEATRGLEPICELRGMRILVAAPGEALCAQIERALTDWGAEVLCVASVPEAMRLLEATPFNAVAIDDSFESLDVGEMLAPVLARRPVRPRLIRIRHFTSLAQQSSGARPWFDAELTKPLRLASLGAAMREGGGTRPEAREPHLRTFSPLAGRVLLVEDQELNREVAGGMLRMLGLSVEEAEDGREALAKLVTAHYDLVLMDCQMPMMDGYMACRELRRLEGTSAHTPVVAMTADATSAEACFESGMDDFVGKPFSRVTLHAALSRWLGASAQVIEPRLG